MSTDSLIADLLKPMYVNRTTITTEWAIIFLGPKRATSPVIVGRTAAVTKA
jgi:hypothetical protein